VKAVELAKKQREISISEFFSKNRHLLGFDNPTKALLTSIKEAVDNALDACEESSILPDVFVEVIQLKEDRFRIIIDDNGPGIVKEQIPKIFGKLLYGSKFHKLSQTRGQQGIGISAAAMYGQLTTGKGILIKSKTDSKKLAHVYELHIDTQKNEPVISKENTVDLSKRQGTRIEFELEAKYQKGRRSVDEYLKQTALVNPHVKLVYKSPNGERLVFPRVVQTLPPEPKEIKPHPYGVELGILIKMLHSTNQKSLPAFLQKEFSRVSAKVAKNIIEYAKLSERARPTTIARKEAENLFNAIKHVKIIAPPTNCLSPVGEESLLKGLKKEIDAAFYTACTRPPAVYRGNPFQVEAAVAYSGELEKEDISRIMRFANKVPLLYQQGACAINKSVIDTAWKNYGISQSKGALPSGPILIMVHIASVWVPFTSESKEAIAHYPEILKEFRLALQECGRKLGIYIRKRKKAQYESQKKSYIEKYIPYVGESLKDLCGLTQKQEKEVVFVLKDVLERSRK